MKKIIALSTLLCTIFNTSVKAKIWRVNNNLNVATDFTNTQACMASASVLNGDTIHIEASATAYQNFNVSKKLTIIGVGYYLTEIAPFVANPKTQANTNICYAAYIEFVPGSKGSTISGISTNNMYLEDSFITVQRCNLSGAVNVNTNGFNTYADTIRQNVLNGGITSYNNDNTKAENLIIYNNIFTGFYCINFPSNTINNNNGYFINNICTNSTSYFTCINFTFQNNIFYNPNFNTYLSSNVYYNCLSTNAILGTANGNQQNVNLDDIFVGWSSAAGYSSDGRFALKSGSSAIGAGVLNGGSIDCGIYGGPAPYVLSGMPSIPSIYTFISPATVASGTTTMNISVSAISH
jgi:hypothetical protein